MPFHRNHTWLCRLVAYQHQKTKKIDLFTLYVLFSQKRSQGNLSLSLFRINYAQICAWIRRNLKGQFCSVLSHDLYWENKTYKVKRSIPGLKSDRCRLRNLSCCRLRESFWNKTVIYKVVACGRWSLWESWPYFPLRVYCYPDPAMEVCFPFKSYSWDNLGKRYCLIKTFRDVIHLPLIFVIPTNNLPWFIFLSNIEIKRHLTLCAKLCTCGATWVLKILTSFLSSQLTLF